MKDREGRVVCPVLYNHTCPICKATGENSHTVRYCPSSEGEKIIIISLVSFVHFRFFVQKTSAR